MADGTEVGVVGFDADPSTTTDPLNSDPDGDGNNGVNPCEDCNNNGRIDSGETDLLTSDVLIGLRKGWGMLSYLVELPPAHASCVGLVNVLGGFAAIEGIARPNPTTGLSEPCDVGGGVDFPVVKGEAYIVQALAGVSIVVPVSPAGLGASTC